MAQMIEKSDAPAGIPPPSFSSEGYVDIAATAESHYASSFSSKRSSLKIIASTSRGTPEEVKIFVPLPCSVAELKAMCVKAFVKLHGKAEDYVIVYNGTVQDDTGNLDDIFGYAPVVRVRFVLTSQPDLKHANTSVGLTLNLGAVVEQTASILSVVSESVGSNLSKMFGESYSDWVNEHYNSMGISVFGLMAIFFLLFGLRIDGNLMSFSIVCIPLFLLQPIHYFVMYCVARYTYESKMDHYWFFLLSVAVLGTLAAFPFLFALKLDGFMPETSYNVVMFPFYTICAYYVILVFAMKPSSRSYKLTIFFLVVTVLPAVFALFNTAVFLDNGELALQYEAVLIAWAVCIVMWTIVGVVYLVANGFSISTFTLVGICVYIFLLSLGGVAGLLFAKYWYWAYGRFIISGFVVVSPVLGYCGIALLLLISAKVIDTVKAKAKRAHPTKGKGNAKRSQLQPQQSFVMGMISKAGMETQDIGKAHHSTKDGFYAYDVREH